MLTFDDGFESMLTVAEPTLSGFGYPSVLFVPTGFVGGTNLFDQGNEPEERICEEQLIELRDSRVELEQHLRFPVDLFAFPFGDNGRDPDDVDALMATSGYRAACLYRGGIQKAPCERPFRLTRIPMGPDSNLEQVLEQLA
jgi:peptidoglycan/xylan/chitin deacetylase (PgdA/CDA1 family)